MNIYIEFINKTDSEDTHIITVCQQHYDDYTYCLWLVEQLKYCLWLDKQSMDNQCVDDFYEYREPTTGICDICNHQSQTRRIGNE
jgi:hypothetical protein